MNIGSNNTFSNDEILRYTMLIFLTNQTDGLSIVEQIMPKLSNVTLESIMFAYETRQNYATLQKKYVQATLYFSKVEHFLHEM